MSRVADTSSWRPSRQHLPTIRPTIRPTSRVHRSPLHSTLSISSPSAQKQNNSSIKFKTQSYLSNSAFKFPKKWVIGAPSTRLPDNRANTALLRVETKHLAPSPYLSSFRALGPKPASQPSHHHVLTHGLQLSNRGQITKNTHLLRSHFTCMKHQTSFVSSGAATNTQPRHRNWMTRLMVVALPHPPRPLHKPLEKPRKRLGVSAFRGAGIGW